MSKASSIVAPKGSASHGCCASRKMHDFGCKLVVVSTLSGVPLVYDLVPAHTDERKCFAMDVLRFEQGATQPV